MHDFSGLLGISVQKDKSSDSIVFNGAICVFLIDGISWSFSR